MTQAQAEQKRSPLKKIRDEIHGNKVEDAQTAAIRRRDIEILFRYPEFHRFLVDLLRRLNVRGTVSHPHANVMNQLEGRRLVGIEIEDQIREISEPAYLRLVVDVEGSKPLHEIAVDKK